MIQDRGSESAMLKLQKRHLISTIKTTMNLTLKDVAIAYMVRKVLTGIERIMLLDMGFRSLKNYNRIDNMHRPLLQTLMH